jgi:hypothetical protein
MALLHFLLWTLFLHPLNLPLQKQNFLWPNLNLQSLQYLLNLLQPYL